MKQLGSEEYALAYLLSIQHGGDYNMFTEYHEVMEHAREREMEELISYVDGDSDKYLELLDKIEEMDLDYTATCPVCGEPITELEERVYKEKWSGIYEALERSGCDNLIELLANHPVERSPQ